MISKKGIIDVNHFLCRGCRLCEMACARKHGADLQTSVSRIKVYQYYPGPIDIPVMCHQCSDYPCVKACPLPEPAISVNDTTGALSIDEEKCIGCLSCADACRHKLSITSHPETGLPMVCDLCGGEPECVKVCPFGVLWFMPGSQFDGCHYSVSNPEEIAESLSLKFYPVREISK